MIVGINADRPHASPFHTPCTEALFDIESHKYRGDIVIYTQIEIH